VANPVKLKAAVTHVECHGPGVFTVRMRSERPIPRFKAGQFLHLALDDYEPAGGHWPVSRVFSIARQPDPLEVWIVYSIKGPYTRRMGVELVPGKQVWLKLPYGSFVVEGSVGPDQDVVLVAGGTGIAPFVPFLEGRLNGSSSTSGAVHLVYGVRECRFLQFGALLSRCASEVKGFVLEIWIEAEGMPDDDRLAERSKRGKIDIPSMTGLERTLREPVYFLSGPPAMVQSIKGSLGDAGVSARRIRVDEWE
jgi:ferredoxin-NADP reductase